MKERCCERCERKAVRRERDAYAVGILRGIRDQCRFVGSTDVFDQAAKAARECYPLPMIRQPRVVGDPHDAPAQWRVVCGRERLEVRWFQHEWQRYPREGEAMVATPERIKLWADLIACPEEEVEDEG